MTRTERRWVNAGVFLLTFTITLLIGAIEAYAETPDPAGTTYDGGYCVEPDGSAGFVIPDATETGNCITAADYDEQQSAEVLATVESQVFPGKSVAEVYNLTDDVPSDRPLGEGLVATPVSYKQLLSVYPI